jgi:hypothetical protein
MQSATGMVMIAGVVFTAAGLVYTACTLHTTEQGQITDRYTRAVEQLGSDKLDIRLGGIYALERVGLQNPDSGTDLLVSWRDYANIGQAGSS